MPKSHPNKRVPKPPLAVRINQQERMRGWSWGTSLGWGISVAGLAITLLVFWPRITVDPDGEIDPADTKSMAFRLTNSGILTLRDVRPALGVCEISGFPAGDDHPIQTCSGPLQSYAFIKAWRASAITIDEHPTIRLWDAIGLNNGSRVTRADISIKVFYFDWMWPIEFQKEFRFTTTQLANGKLVWTPMPIWR